MELAELVVNEAAGFEAKGRPIDRLDERGRQRLVEERDRARGLGEDRLEELVVRSRMVGCGHGRRVYGAAPTPSMGFVRKATRGRTTEVGCP